MIRSEEVFQIGRLTRTHGVQGEMELQFTDDAFDRGTADYVVLLIDGIFVPFFFEEYRFKNHDAALIKFEEVHSEVEARPLVGLPVYYPHEALADVPEGEIRSLQHFVGYTVLLPDAGAPQDGEMATRHLGTVEHVSTTASTALLTVRTDDGKEVFLPFHEDFVLAFDRRARYLLLNLSDDLLTLND